MSLVGGERPGKNSVDILVVGMDKITDKSCYIYDALEKVGIRSLIYSRDKTNLYQAVRGRVRTRIVIVPRSIVLETLGFVYLLLRYKPKHVDLYSTYIVAQVMYTLVSRLCRVPHVMICIGELYGWDSHRAARRIAERLSLRMARLVVLTELYMADTIKKHKLARQDKLVFCHNRIPIRKGFSNDRTGQIVLFLNTFKPWRRIEILIKAIPIVVEKIPDAKFLVVGSSRDMNYLRSTQSYEAKLKKMIQEAEIEKCIEVLPFCADPWKYYEVASVFVLPADLVFCNFSLLEAMERCVVPIVSDVEGASLIVDHGVNGFIEKQDHHAFAQAIIRVLSDDDLRKDMGRRAREKIIKEYNIDTNVKILLDAYKEYLRTWKM